MSAPPQEVSVIDVDTMQAVLARWNQDLVDIPAEMAIPPRAGRLESQQEGTPYASIRSEMSRREKVNNKGVWFDWRKVTIVVRGNKDDVQATVVAVKKTFNDMVQLVYPSGANFMRWWPATSDRFEIDPERKSGEDVWMGTVEAIVWSARTD